MPQKTFAGGLALQKNIKNTLLPSALLCLPGACDNDDAADNVASDNPAPAASSGRAVGEMFRDALLISDGEGPEMVVLPTGRFASPPLPARADWRASGSRFWAGCVMIEGEPFRRNNL